MIGDEVREVIGSTDFQTFSHALTDNKHIGKVGTGEMVRKLRKRARHSAQKRLPGVQSAPVSPREANN